MQERNSYPTTVVDSKDFIKKWNVLSKMRNTVRDNGAALRYPPQVKAPYRQHLTL